MSELTAEFVASLLRSVGLKRKDIWDPRPAQRADGTLNEGGQWNDRVKCVLFNKDSPAVLLLEAGREDLLPTWMLVLAPGVEYPNEEGWRRIADIMDDADPLPDSWAPLDKVHGQMTLDQYLDCFMTERGYQYYVTRKQLLEWRSDTYRALVKCGDVTESFGEWASGDQWLGDVRDDEYVDTPEL
jgi:hypothetical protein